MFDFEKLQVYQSIRELNGELIPSMRQLHSSDPYLCDQLKRASLSAMLNLSEGAGRETMADKRRFYVMARASVFESVSILQVLLDIEIIDREEYDSYYLSYERISKALYGLIKSTKR